MISFKKRRVPFRHIAAIAVVALMFGLVNVATVQRVFAQVDIGPNADWFGEEDGPVTGAGNQNIPIYVFNGSTTIHPTITVTASDSSSGYSGTMAAACISLSGSCSGTWCQINPNCAFTIPPSSFVYDPTVGGWTAMVYAHLMQGGIHEFRLTASNGATIGYYASKNPAVRLRLLTPIRRAIGTSMLFLLVQTVRCQRVDRLYRQIFTMVMLAITASSRFLLGCG
jgi:hypothetical protein